MDLLSYKDLQAKARELGIKANQKKDALVSALMEASVSTSAPPPTAAAEPAATTAVAPAAAAKPAAVAAQAPAPAVAAPAPVVVSIPTKAKSPAAAAAVGGAERAGKGGSRERDGARDRDGRERSRHRDGRDRDRRDRDRDRSGRDGGHDRSRRRERDGGHDRHRHRDERDRRPKKEGEGGGAESGGGAAAEGGEGKPREERSKRSRSGSRSRSHSRHKKHRRRRDRSGSESDDSGDRRRRKKKKKKKKKKSSLFTDAPPNLAAMMAQINPALLAQMPAQMQMMAAQLGGNPAAAVQMPPMGMGLPLGMPPMMGMGRGMGMGAAPRPYMKAAAFGGGGGLGGGGLGGGGGPGTGANGGGGSDPQTKPSRELYIGNMPEMSIPEQLKVFITSAMEQGGMTTGPGTPIVTVRCSAKFAFCEFRSIEECNLAMNMNGITYNGRVLNIGRPRQYTGPQTVSSTWGEWCAQKGVVNPIGGNAGIFHSAPLHKGGDAQTKNYRELYIGNCPEGITEPQLIKFVSDAMALAKLTTAEGSPVIQVRVNGRFSFAEFRSIEECNNALNLNGIELGGTQLRVGRPKAYDGPSVPCGTWNDLIAKGLDAIKAQGAGGPSMGGGGYGGQFGANAPISAAAGVAPTNVLQLSNMVTPQELSDDSEHADILEDVKQEMGKFGIVGRVEIPRTGAGAGQIYVAFGQMGDALKCINGMRGRTFGGNTVAAHFYPENMFLQNKFVDISLPGAAAVVPLAAVPVMQQQQQQQQYAPPMQPPMQPPAGGGFAPPMAAQGGRGRAATMPAWMTKS